MSNPNIATDSPTTWKPGQSGNPAGRPKLGESLAEKMRKFLEAMAEGESHERLEELFLKLYGQGKKGNVHAIKEAFDRGYGKSIQRTEIVIDPESRLKEIVDRVEGNEKNS